MRYDHIYVHLCVVMFNAGYAWIEGVIWIAGIRGVFFTTKVCKFYFENHIILNYSWFFSWDFLNSLHDNWFVYWVNWKTRNLNFCEKIKKEMNINEILTLTIWIICCYFTVNMHAYKIICIFYETTLWINVCL